MLHRAGIEQADGLAAVTSSDSVNAVVGHVARTVYRVPNVVTRNYDPRWRPLHEAFGLQMVSSATWGAQRLEELLEHGESAPSSRPATARWRSTSCVVPEPGSGRQPARPARRDATAGRWR